MEWKREKYGVTGEVSFSETEWNKLIAVVSVLDEELLLRFAVTTGLRREDVVNIQIENINLEEKTLTFYERKKRKWRTIPLQDNVVKLITQYLGLVKKKKGKLFDFSGRTAYNILNRNCDKAGIKRKPFHALRATCVKFCIKAGWSFLEIAKLTGDTVLTLQQHYAIPSAGDMQEVVKEKPII